MKITLENGDCGCYLIVAEDGRDILIQSDWDYPGIASTFGWVPCAGSLTGTDRESCIVDCECFRYTDGTVKCSQCGKTASGFISEAGQFLDDNIGASCDDPGYFD
jgi:hypothetical protein